MKRSAVRSVCIIAAVIAVLTAGLIIVWRMRVSNEDQQILSEYELYRTADLVYEAELSAVGYSDSMIDELWKMTFEDELTKICSLSDAALRKYGYDEEQIDEIRLLCTEDESYDHLKTEEMILSLGGYIEDGITITAQFSWSWREEPDAQFTDIAYISWQVYDIYGREISVETVFAQSTIVYTDQQNGSLSIASAETIYDDIDNITYVEIPMQSTEENSAVSGTLVVQMSIMGSNEMDSIDICGTYRHSEEEEDVNPIALARLYEIADKDTAVYSGRATLLQMTDHWQIE